MHRTENDRNMEHESIPFSESKQIITYYLRCNPARAKSINLLEREARSHPTHGYTNETLWAQCFFTIQRTLENLDFIRKKVFYLYELQSHVRPNIQDVAREIGRSRSRTYDYLHDAHDELEREAVRRGLIPEPEDDEEKERV